MFTGDPDSFRAVIQNIEGKHQDQIRMHWKPIKIFKDIICATVP